MKFRLNFGKHTENRKLYTAGDVVETERDLAALYPIFDADRRVRKFTAVDDVTPQKPTFKDMQ